jgi:hypothetical protein
MYQAVQLIGGDVLISADARLNFLDDVDGGLGTHIARNERLLELIEDFSINVVLTRNQSPNLAKERAPRLFEPFIEARCVMFALKAIKKCHDYVD